MKGGSAWASEHHLESMCQGCLNLPCQIQGPCASQPHGLVGIINFLGFNLFGLLWAAIAPLYEAVRTESCYAWSHMERLPYTAAC